MKQDKSNTFSLRRRHLMIAAVAGLTVPAALLAAQRSPAARVASAETELYANEVGNTDKLVVSGRILGGPDGMPLAGATLEAWHADPVSGRGGQDDSDRRLRTSVITDADGRFVFTILAPTGHSGRARQLDYRVSRQGHAAPVKQLHFTTRRGVAENNTAQLQRDDAGTWRATFGLTLA